MKVIKERCKGSWDTHTIPECDCLAASHTTNRTEKICVKLATTFVYTKLPLLINAFSQVIKYSPSINKD